MADPGTVVRVRPDRLTVWPTEDGTYGLDARWGGPEGSRQAYAVRDAGRAGGLSVQLQQDADGRGWSVRLGPLERDVALRVIETFLV
jgi:hypothetical protein